MREMKDSGVEWIGEIPEDWNVGKTLYALSMPITDGPHETPELFDEGIPFISAEAVSCGNGGSHWNTVRQLLMLLRKPPFSVVSSMAFTSSTLRGGSALSAMFAVSCRIWGGKFCHPSFKVPHFLSVSCDKGCPLLNVPGEKHVHQVFHPAHVLQGFHKPGVPRFIRLAWAYSSFQRRRRW